MATYAVGDIQGCFAAFLRLLEKIRFNPRGDRLWLVGDIVNRGPNSLDALRWVYENRRRVAVVLGNHDIHLLMVREGFAQAHGADTLDEILAAPDAEKLCDWLRHCPLFHWENGWAMVHAGLLPQWTIADAARLSQEVEKVFASSDYRDFLQVIYGNEPAKTAKWNFHTAATRKKYPRIISHGLIRRKEKAGMRRFYLGIGRRWEMVGESMRRIPLADNY